MNIKVCGMREPTNVLAVSNLPFLTHIGFIFYEKSARFVGDDWPASVCAAVPAAIQKVGVFVNESEEKMLSLLSRYGLAAAQLHGEESAAQCRNIKKAGFSVIKAFSVDEHFDFSHLAEYVEASDFFLFDTKGKSNGGNGITFDWSILDKYPYEKPFFLSGGLSPDNIAAAIAQIKSPYLVGLDLNSKFETEPALKNITLLESIETLL